MSPTAAHSTLARRLAAEALGTALLLMAVVGSGIVTSVSGVAPAQLFMHAVAVGGTLTALILTFGHVSGAHFNPVVTAAQALLGNIGARAAAAYVAAQVAGAVIGTVAAHLMFGLPAAALGTHDRLGLGIAGGEVVATFGLVVVIVGVVRSGRTGAVPGAVGAYIGTAIFWTSSAAFANPAVTVARALTDTYVAISPRSVPGFLLAQALGGALAVGLAAWLFRPGPEAGPVGAHATRSATRSEEPLPMPDVLFVCVHNAGRSRMAEALFNRAAAGRWTAVSAGTEPASRPHPEVVVALAEVGIDLPIEPGRLLDPDLAAGARRLYAMGCDVAEACPALSIPMEDWMLADPRGQPIERVREIRDEIAARVAALVVALDAEAGIRR